jgi:tight adherence protein C
VFILLILGVALLAGCAVLLARAFALPRLRAMEHIGRIDAYGFSAPDEQAEPPRAMHGALDHVAKALGSFFESRMQGLSEAEMRRELMAAGMYRTSPVTLIGYRVISAVSVPATVLWIVSSARMAGISAILLVAISIAIGWLGPMIVVRRRARMRLERIDLELPELVDLLVVTVEAGLGLASSMQLAAQRSSGPLGDELRLALQEQAMGLQTDQVLANILTRSDTPALRSFVRSVRQGEALGVSIGQIMRNLSVEMRKRRFASAEERAQKAPVKMLFPLVALIFPALFIVLLAPAIISFTASLGGAS